MPEQSNSELTFTLNLVNDNPLGWGPNNVPEKYQDLPYQKFSKSDRIGKVADWNLIVHNTDKKNMRYQPQFAVGNVGGQYAYFHDEDESQFTLVDQSRVNKPQYQKKFKNINNRNNRRYQKNFNPKLPGGGKQMGGGKDGQNKNMMGGNKKMGGNYNNKKNNRNQIKAREPSVKVKDDWRIVEEIEFSRLAKLSLPSVDTPVDLKVCGSLEYYDKNYDRINTKVITATNKLKRINRAYHNVTTTDDPVIRSLAKTEGTVYATDSIIATLMCCSRSVYPWDIVVSKIGNKLFFDKRDDSNFDLLTVGETSSEPPQADDSKHINSASSLALEATFINHNLAQQVLLMNKERHTFAEPNPFAEGDEIEIASVAYKYRKWDLGNSIQLIVRSEIDAVTTGGSNDEKKYLNIKALNEWDPKANSGLDWRMKLDSQPGAVLAAEIKNNGCKLAKWTVCSLLAGVDQLKFGFVSRSNARATDSHLILGMQQFKPEEFASQMALNLDNAWGIVRCIVDMLNREKDGKYIIMKDPNKPMIRLYEVPENALSEEEDGDINDNDEN